MHPLNHTRLLVNLNALVVQGSVFMQISDTFAAEVVDENEVEVWTEEDNAEVRVREEQPQEVPMRSRRENMGWMRWRRRKGSPCFSSTKKQGLGGRGSPREIGSLASKCSKCLISCLSCKGIGCACPLVLEEPCSR